MDHKDFDKIFSDKLKETQDFEFMESDWENVLSRIEVPEKQKRRGAWLLLFSLGFLMMAGTSLYLAISLRETNQHLMELKEALAKSAEREKMEEQVLSAALTEEGSTSIPTTTVQGEVEEQISSSSAALTQEGFIPTASVPEDGLKTKDQTVKTLTNNDWLNSSDKAINLTFVEAGPKTTTLLPTDKAADQTVSDFRLTTLKANSWATGQNLLPKGEMEYLPVLTKVNQLKKLAWKYLSVGITGGLSLPRKLSLTDSKQQLDEFGQSGSWLADISNDLSANRKIGFDVGLLLQYQLSKRWQLSGALAYQQINYEPESGYFASTLEQLQYKDLGEIANEVIILAENNLDSTNSPPVVNSTLSDTIRFGSTTIKQKAIEYRLGANYVLRPGKKWRPYMGLSVSAISLRQQELWGNIYGEGYALENFSARSSATDKISNLNIKASSFRWNGILLSTGFQLAINQRLNWQMEAWYQQPFETRSDQLYNLAGLRTGILFGF